MQNMWHVVCLQKSGSSDIFEDLSFQRLIGRKTAEHQYDTWGGVPFEYYSSLKMLAIFTLLRYTTGFYFAFPGSNYSE